MNMRWWHSQRILMVSLATAMLAVGVLTALVIRQQRGQATGQIYLETSGTLGAKPFVPRIGPPQTVGGNAGSGGASIQATAGPEHSADANGSSRVPCACDNPPAPMIPPKAQPTHRGMPLAASRSPRMIVSQRGPRCGSDESYRGGRCYGWDQPGRPNGDGPP